MITRCKECVRRVNTKHLLCAYCRTLKCVCEKHNYPFPTAPTRVGKKTGPKPRKHYEHR